MWVKKRLVFIYHSGRCLTGFHWFYVCRNHTALADLSCLLLHLPLPVHLVVPAPDLEHADVQLHVCSDGHLQRRTSDRPLPLPVPVLSGVRLDQ